jgi:2',3'-cyclic-nucleotide 2'-phosphodiesterase/3'-nucleotidase/5'-nucleotidase
VVATEAGVAYVTNGAQDRIDVFDIASGMRTDTLDLSFVDDYDGVQSVAVSRTASIAAAVAREGALDGVVVLFDTDGTVLNEVTVGNLPDMVTFTPDGTEGPRRQRG